MKSGISLVDMAKEIQRQADLKADYMLDTRSLRLEPFDSKLYLNAYDQSGVPALEPLEVNSIAHRQIGTHLKIPAAYYDEIEKVHCNARNAFVPAGSRPLRLPACQRLRLPDLARCGDPSAVRGSGAFRNAQLQLLPFDGSFPAGGRQPAPDGSGRVRVEKSKQ